MYYKQSLKKEISVSSKCKCEWVNENIDSIKSRNCHNLKGKIETPIHYKWSNIFTKHSGLGLLYKWG